MRRLPAGHALVLGRRAESRCAAGGGRSLGVREQARESSVLEVREAFDEAVRGRLRTRDGVSCDVSGGYDSSTVIATAVALGGDVRAVGLAFRQDPEADEVSHQQAVADHLGLPLDAPRGRPPRRRRPVGLRPAARRAVVRHRRGRHGRHLRLGRGPRVLGVAHRRGRGRGACTARTSVSVDLAARGRLRQALTTAGRTGLAPLEAGRWIATSLAREAAVTAAESGRCTQRPRPHRSGSDLVSGVWTVPTPG